MKLLSKLLIIISIIIFGCSENTYRNCEFGNIPKELIDSLVRLDSNILIQTIRTDKPNTIVGKKGTIVVIPQGAFINENGKSFNDSVIFELKENFTISDFILSNLQTIQNDKILVSKGMIYIKATDKYGNILNIANNMSIRIQIPQKEYNDSSKIFLGQRDESGHINWIDIEEPSKTLVPYPIKFISENRYWTECLNYYGIRKDTSKYRSCNYYGEITDFENTLLATKEFKDRFSITCWDSILHIYINNLDKNMWEIDELAVKYLIKDSIRYLNSWVCEPPKGINGGPVTKLQKESYKESIRHYSEEFHQWIDMYRDYAKQKLTKIDRTKLIDTSKLADINSVFISYDALNLGWINVDYFYNDSKAEKIKLIAKMNEKVAIVNLIIKGKNVILSGIEKNNNEYFFTKNEDGYNKLPKGEKAIIIAISIKNNELIFGEKEFIIGDSELQQIDLKPIQGDVLKEKLKNYGS